MITSGHKVAKKMRQVMRKDFQESLQPKPRWIPWRLWICLMSFFIKIQDTK